MAIVGQGTSMEEDKVVELSYVRLFVSKQSAKDMKDDIISYDGDGATPYWYEKSNGKHIVSKFSNISRTTGFRSSFVPETLHATCRCFLIMHRKSAAWKGFLAASLACRVLHPTFSWYN